MADILPKSLSALIDGFSALPGVGRRTAERYAYFTLRQDVSISSKLADALTRVHSGIKVCPITFALIDADKEVSALYSDAKRDKTTVAVVAEPFDIIAIENTNQFDGTYHVLGGLISPLDGIGPEQLHIQELVDRIKRDNVKEVIVATNASVEGETTALYIQEALKASDIALTRLARGLPIGVDLEYADQITLTRALQGRTAL
ncbi:MAG TPA: recombination mediator RecR [Candidatus Saccharibacteria bacterium]|nr:recombination protein RecR [Candidatus Saccharibacteria bacterium]MCB9817150.1 recombination protein RecR [Candidatus Nomurabacteria bacterium]HPR10321.1 recombination mediator RecR [Candidatus Saccharibacteria bacterium]